MVNNSVFKNYFKASSRDFPHLMFYGPSGSGKKTRIMCVLRELYGPGAMKLKIQQQTFTVSNTEVFLHSIVQLKRIKS